MAINCWQPNIHTQHTTHTHTQHTNTHTHHNTHTQPTHNTHTHTTHTHHTHSHTHVGFYGLRGLSIGVMVFILYKLYYAIATTPKLSPHRRRCIYIFPKKNSLCMIISGLKLWGHWKCPHKSPSPCNTYVIPSVIIQICVLINHINMPTHTHHTHTHTMIYEKFIFSVVYPFKNTKMYLVNLIKKLKACS